MKASIASIAIALGLTACSNHNSAPHRPSDAQSEAYMRQAERDWAQLAPQQQPALLKRILAADYVGVSSHGHVHDKAQQIAGDSDTSSAVQATLDYVHYHHYGDTVVAQGQETVPASEKRPAASKIWIDVWMFRDGKWQIVASEDSFLPSR